MRIAFLNWRDTANPEGGGSEVYVEEIAARLVERGHVVTVVCAAHDRAPAQDSKRGIRFVRRGTKLTVYAEARRLLRRGALGPVDVVVDVQNGIPFLSPWTGPAPVVVLVHHVHREQWPVVYDPVRSRIGWWVESRVAPWAYRHCRYIAVSTATREELARLGVDRGRISVIRNGTPVGPGVPHAPDPEPRVLVLGRLVPHKRVEHVLEAAAWLRDAWPGLRVAVVGDGWWADSLHERARELRVDDIVEFAGHVSDEEKLREISRSWVLGLPSLKEGWGLVVMEAASVGVPAIAYRSAGGVTESIVDGETGVLVDGGVHEFTSALDALLRDDEGRRAMGERARARSQQFTWEQSVDQFERVLEEAWAEGSRLSWWSRRRRTAHPRSAEPPSARR